MPEHPDLARREILFLLHKLKLTSCCDNCEAGQVAEVLHWLGSSMGRNALERIHAKDMQTTTIGNARYAAQILLKDPETQEELFPSPDGPSVEDGATVLVVGTRGGVRKWKHTIRTEELA